MTVYDILSINVELLTTLARAGVAVEDARYVALYREFCAMRATGEKTTYIVAHIREKYAVSDRTVWRVVRKFSSLIFRD